jgi:hypothetical protein
MDQSASGPVSPVRIRMAFQQLEDEDLAVADLAGVGGLADDLDHLLDQVVVDGGFQLHLGQEVDHILGATVQLGVALLASETLDLGDGDALHADLRQGLAHVIELEGLDNGVVQAAAGEQLVVVVGHALFQFIVGEGQGMGGEFGLVPAKKQGELGIDFPELLPQAAFQLMDHPEQRLGLGRSHLVGQPLAEGLVAHGKTRPAGPVQIPEKFKVHNHLISHQGPDSTPSRRFATATRKKAKRPRSAGGSPAFPRCGNLHI